MACDVKCPVCGKEKKRVPSDGSYSCACGVHIFIKRGEIVKVTYRGKII